MTDWGGAGRALSLSTGRGWRNRREQTGYFDVSNRSEILLKTNDEDKELRDKDG